MSVDVDEAVLELLRAIATDAAPLAVYDGDVTDADQDAKTISAPLPYVVFYTTPGYPITPRMSGRRGRAVVFTVNSVGLSRSQAKWAGDQAEAALDGKRIVLDHRGALPRLIRRTDDNAFLRRDDTWTRPGGKPLFTDSRRFHIAAR